MTGQELHDMEKKIATDNYPTMLFYNWENLSDEVQRFYNDKAKALTGRNLLDRISSLPVNEQQEVYEWMHGSLGLRIYK